MSLRDRLEYLAFLGASAAVRRLPLPLVQRAGARAAELWFRAGGKQVGYVLENLRIVYPELDEAERRAIGVASYRAFAWNAIDLLRSFDWSREDIAKRVTIHGIEHLERALARGRGAFFLTLHLGNFELAVRAMNAAGHTVAAVGRPMRNPLLYARLRASRTAFGGELIDRDNSAPRILRVLRENGVVGVMNDQYPGRRHGVWVPFFGVRASTARGIATLALRTGAAVLPGFIWRDAPDHHTVEIWPALEVESTGDRARDVERAAAAQNRALERIIRAHPDQWMWAHRRFRYSPDLPENVEKPRA